MMRINGDIETSFKDFFAYLTTLKLTQPFL